MTGRPGPSFVDVNDAERAIFSRRAVRRFLPSPVDLGLVERLLAVAARAPSGTNMQPWNAHVVVGRARDRLCAALCEAYDRGEAHEAEHPFYPDPFFEPYLSRRRKVGLALYGLLGIGREDKEEMHAQHRRNLLFFDAPVGLIFTIDRRLEIGSWLDYGMYLQSFMIAARSHGLDSCPQAAFAQWHHVIRRCLPIGEDQAVVCGMALGKADPDAPENRLVTDRVAPGDFARFHID